MTVPPWRSLKEDWASQAALGPEWPTVNWLVHLGRGGGECKTGRPQGAEEISCFGLGQRGRRLSLRKAGSAGPGAPSPHTAGRNPFPRSLFLDTAVNLRVHFLVKQHLYQMAWLSDAQEQLLRSTSGTWPASWCRHIHHQQSQ